MQSDNPWCDPDVAAQQAALNDAELRRPEWPPHFLAFAVAIRDTQCSGSILEVGCGSGVGRAILTTAQVPFARYLGVDISAAAIVQAKSRYPDGDWAQVTEATGYRPRGFDLVADAACLMHVDDWEDHLVQIAGAARQWLVLHRVPVGPKTERCETQGYGATFPAWRFHEPDLHAELAPMGFSLARPIALPDGYVTQTWRRA